MKVLVEHLRSLNGRKSKGVAPMHARCIKLVEDFYKPKKNLFNVASTST